LERHIDSNKTIIMLQNRDDVFIPLQPIRAILANQKLHDTKSAKTLPESVLAKYVGVYMANGKFRNIFKKGGEYLFFADGALCKMYFTDEKSFFNTEFPSEKEFTFDEKGRVTGYRLIYFGRELQTATKIANVDTLVSNEVFFNEAGWNFLENKDFSQATTYLKRGLELYPNSSIIKCNLAHCYLFSNDMAKALEIYRLHANDAVASNLTMREMVKQDFDYFTQQGFDKTLMDRVLRELEAAKKD
jgi:tetratricopeptide (TPR) repeat protein